MIDETGVRLGIEIRSGNADLKFVLQSLGEGFIHLHGVNLLLSLVRRMPDHYQSIRRATV